MMRVCYFRRIDYLYYLSLDQDQDQGLPRAFDGDTQLRGRFSRGFWH